MNKIEELLNKHLDYGEIVDRDVCVAELKALILEDRKSVIENIKKNLVVRKGYIGENEFGYYRKIDLDTILMGLSEMEEKE